MAGEHDDTICRIDDLIGTAPFNPIYCTQFQLRVQSGLGYRVHMKSSVQVHVCTNQIQIHDSSIKGQDYSKEATQTCSSVQVAIKKTPHQREQHLDFQSSPVLRFSSVLTDSTCSPSNVFASFPSGLDMCCRPEERDTHSDAR